LKYSRVAEEINKIEENCMKFLRSGETQVMKLLEMIKLGNHVIDVELPNKE